MKVEGIVGVSQVVRFEVNAFSSSRQSGVGVLAGKYRGFKVSVVSDRLVFQV